MRSRLAVIVVADIVGYSSMMADDEEQGIAAVRDVNDQFVQPTTTLHEGEVLKRMGAGRIVAFGSVHSAINSAVEVLSALSQHRSLKIRIGAHIGEIFEDDEDFYGAGVNLAARLQGEAPPGGLVVDGFLLTGSFEGHRFPGMTVELALPESSSADVAHWTINGEVRDQEARSVTILMERDLTIQVVNQ